MHDKYMNTTNYCIGTVMLLMVDLKCELTQVTACLPPGSRHLLADKKVLRSASGHNPPEASPTSDE